MLGRATVLSAHDGGSGGDIHSPVAADTLASRPQWGAQSSPPPPVTDKKYAALQSRAAASPATSAGTSTTMVTGRTAPAAAVASISSRPSHANGGGNCR